MSDTAQQMYGLIYIGKRMKEADNSPRDQRAAAYLEIIAKLLYNLAMQHLDFAAQHLDTAQVKSPKTAAHGL